MKDPYLPQIFSLLAVGGICTGFSVSGYLHSNEQVQIGGVSLNYPAPVRKIPLAMLGAGFCISAWWLNQDRKDYRTQYIEWQRSYRQATYQQQAIAAQADLQAYQQVAALQAAERYYPQMAPYLEAEAKALPNQPAPAQLQGASPPAAPPPPVQTAQSTPPAETAQPAPTTTGEQSGVLPVRDLTAEIAKYDGHILIASRTRSGKTTSIQSAIRHTHGRYNGNIEFHIFDPKGASWCGLEANENRYLFCNEPSHIPLVLNRLEDLISTMQSRQRKRMKLGGHYTPGNFPSPIIVAIDEFNTMQSLAQEYDESFPVKENPKTQKKIQRYVERFIFQGAEDKTYIWLMAQTTRVEQLGLNTSVQDNMAYFAQSRNGDYQSVEDAISNSYVVSNPAQRKELNQLLTTYRYDSNEDLKIPIAFTTLGGNQLCKMPDLSQAKFHQVVAVQPPVEQPPQPPEPPPMDIRQRLEFCLHSSPQFEQVSLSDAASRLLKYLLKKGGWLTTREIKKNWGQNNGQSSAQVDDLLTELLDHGRVEQQAKETPDQTLWRGRQQHGTE